MVLQAKNGINISAKIYLNHVLQALSQKEEEENIRHTIGIDWIMAHECKR